MDLYFVALIPHLALRKEIKALKKEIHTNTGAKKALNSPAHITIQRPFKRDNCFEDNLVSNLNLFAAKQKSFVITLSGFDCFKPRTIFVDVQESPFLKKLNQEINSVLFDELDFDQKELSTNINPHITIATRDLNKKEFFRVWPTYKNRVFDAKFMVKSIFLLKHNGKNWDIIQEFLFKN
jgi:2'-5' RNA ligase